MEAERPSDCPRPHREASRGVGLEPLATPPCRKEHTELGVAPWGSGRGCSGPQPARPMPGRVPSSLLNAGRAQPPGGSTLAGGPPAGAQVRHPSPHLSCLPPNSEKLAGTKLDVEEIALTALSQRHKLQVVLEATNRSLQAEEQAARWSVDGAWASGGWCPGGREPGPVRVGAAPRTHWAPLGRLRRGPSLWAGEEAEASGRCKVGTKSRSGLRSKRPQALLSPTVSLQRSLARGPDTINAGGSPCLLGSAYPGAPTCLSGGHSGPFRERIAILLAAPGCKKRGCAKHQVPLLVNSSL